jgi:DNA-binding LytR/AlgR family response regulator
VARAPLNREPLNDEAMRLLIVDDEPAARQRLAALVEEVDPSIEIVGEAADGLTAIELVKERRPDVVLLDIAMREVDGFDVARHLAEPRPLIIFQTAFQEFAVRAFEHEALDYLVKPVRRERLAQALDRARVRLAAVPAKPGWDRSALDRLGAALRYRAAPSARLLVRHGAGHRLIRVRDVLRFSAAEGLVYAHTGSGSHVTDYTLNELEARMGEAFIRTSRADLVNLAEIAQTATNGDGSATLTLRNGATVRVSRRRAAAVWQRLER